MGKTTPGCVPAGILTFSSPSMVGTLTSAPTEERMRFDVEDHVQVAARAAAGAGFAFVGESNLCAGVHAGRNVHDQTARVANLPAPFASMTDGGDRFAQPVAGGAGGGGD